jgi:hypothetical protein
MNKQIIIFIIIIIILIYYYIKLINEKYLTDDSSNIIKLGNNYIQLINLDEFNKIFDSEMVNLPKYLYAIGFDYNNIYIYSNKFNLENKYYIIEEFLKYWINNIHIHMSKHKYYFILPTRDGYRERILYNSNNKFIEYKAEYNEFKNSDEITVKNNNLIPILHKNKYIFSFAKHKNDPYTVAVVDFMYLENNGYDNKIIKYIKDNFVKWEDKINMCVWRGNIVNGNPYNFFDPDNKDNLNPRSYFKKLYDEKKINNMNYSSEYTTIAEQLKYKYILDIDGWSSTWDGTFWKLYSGSVLLKQKSIWKQWYYDELIEWVHYVPIENDFSNLNEQIEWCMNNDEKCKEISINSRKFVLEKLNWDNVKNHMINTVKDYI